MIGRISGKLLEKQAPEVLIEAGGIGYEVQVPMTSFYQLPELGQAAVLYTHFVVREDAQLLFGFANKTERSLFRELIKVNGVGPKMALAILSGMSAEQFVNCVSHDDLTALVKIPGVGKKTAERLLIEMRDKLSSLFSSNELNTSAPTTTAPVLPSGNQHQQEALSALIALGYKPTHAEKVIKQVSAEGKNSEALIRDALKAML